MKLRILFLLVLGLWNSFVFGQGRINNYLFGYDFWPKALLNFPNNIPSVNIDSNISLRMRYAHANISAGNGNLLFYTNGVTVMDGNHDTMPNGKGLNPCQYTTQAQYTGLSISQADIILPDPGNANGYYLIHQSIGNYPTNFTNNNLYYSKIDMTLNNGKGDLTQKNFIFFQDSLWPGCLTACKHANGRDWWIVATKAYLPDYFVFLLSPLGLVFNSTQTIGARWDGGQTAFSNDGNYYGIREYAKNFQVFDFDRCSGLFSNARIVLTNDSLVGSGLCFSPDSKLVYATSAYHLYQSNLDSLNLTTGTQVVANWDSTYDPVFGPPVAASFEFMQIGPDGKIYMNSIWATHYMHCINFPDSIGAACGMQQHSMVLPTPNGNTMPNFVNYFLGPVVGSICDSLTGIHEHLDEIINFDIKPNPASDMFTISYLLPQNKPGIFEMYDKLGKKVYTMPLPQWSTLQHIATNQFAAGIYIGVISSNNKKIEEKIVVIKD